MIKHIYLIKLKDPSRKQIVADKMMTLKDHVPEIYQIEVGMDFKGDRNSYDICEYITFKNEEDFRAFGANEYHEQIRQFMAGETESSYKIDYVSQLE